MNSFIWLADALMACMLSATHIEVRKPLWRARPLRYDTRHPVFIIPVKPTKYSQLHYLSHLPANRWLLFGGIFCVLVPSDCARAASSF